MKVDILMATYNGEKYLHEQIESILNQTYQNFSLIIQDDCSTDNTVNIIKTFNDPRISFFQNKKNLGYIKNFESLIKKANSDLIMLSDQDDYWLNEKVEKSVQKLLKSNVDLVYGDLFITNQNLVKAKRSFWEAEDIKPVRGNCFREISIYNVASGCTLIFNHRFLDKIIPFPSSPIIHDWWITFVYAYFGKIDYLEEKYILYRQHGLNNIGLTNDYYDNTKNKIIDYLASTNKFLNHRIEIIKRNQKIANYLYSYCSKVFPTEKTLVKFLKKNQVYFTKIQNHRLIYLNGFRLKIYRSRGKIGVLVFIVLNFPLILYIFHPIMKVFKRGLKNED